MIRVDGGVRGATEPGSPASEQPTDAGSAQPPRVGSVPPASVPSPPRAGAGLEGPRGSTRRRVTQPRPGADTDSLSRAARGLRRPRRAAVRDARGFAPGSGSERSARIIRAFAAVLRQSPEAGHEERARLLAGVILDHVPAGALLRGSGAEQDRARLLDVVSAELAGSPELSRLVDEVTAGARGGRRG